MIEKDTNVMVYMHLSHHYHVNIHRHVSDVSKYEPYLNVCEYQGYYLMEQKIQ